MKRIVFVVIAFVMVDGFAEDFPSDYGQCLIVVEEPLGFGNPLRSGTKDPPAKFGTKEYAQQQKRMLKSIREKYISSGMTNRPFWYLKLRGLMGDRSNRADRVQIWNLKNEKSHWIRVGETVGTIRVLEADWEQHEAQIQVGTNTVVLSMGEIRKGEPSRYSIKKTRDSNQSINHDKQ